MPTIFPSLELIPKRFNGVLLDAYGVFWGGNSFGLLPGSMETMEKLVLNGVIVGILSNATQLAANEKEKLSRHGLEENSHYHFLITAGDVAKQIFHAEKLPFKTPKKKYWVFGGVHPKYSPHQAIFQGTPYTEAQTLHDADFIFISVPHLHGEDQTDPGVFRNEVFKILHAGLPMVCANPDQFAHEGSPPKQVVRQGGIAKIYEEFGGEVFYIGKPTREAYQAAMLEFSRENLFHPKEILMIGDTPETDIRGARNYGMNSALVMNTGIMADRISSIGLENAIKEFPPFDYPDYFIERFA